ncbi:hypothetical protein [Leucobacter musarum]|uniref:hypothetical protein n=1 Tax=Leucobacter musarum TaxID=1930747 RepID=UPI0006A77A17|nr:hypothetical protein [Leucobacter musarum]
MRSLRRGAAIAGAVTFFVTAFGGATAATAAPQPIEIVEQAPEGTTRLWLDLESGDGVAPGSTAIQQALSRTGASAPVDLLIAGGALLLTAATFEVLRRRRACVADPGIEGQAHGASESLAALARRTMAHALPYPPSAPRTSDGARPQPRPNSCRGCVRRQK